MQWHFTGGSKEVHANRKLTFELEDSRGNKIFRKAAQTSKFGVASAEFALADEVNLGAYHLRAVMDDATNRSEITVRVEKYVLPKFKVAVEFTGANRHGYRPGEHVTGVVRANYFFGKPVHGEVSVKATGMDVAEFQAGKAANGSTDEDGAFRFDIKLPDFVAVAAQIGVKEVYLQRLVFFEQEAIGMARPDQALFERLSQDEANHLAAAEAQAKALGISFNASGATEPGTSLKKAAEDNPWSLCRRPWSVMYFTANGRALPCCIAPFSQRGYDNYTIGDATQSTLREIWNGPAYQTFRETLQSGEPPKSCQSCGLRWSL